MILKSTRILILSEIYSNRTQVDEILKKERIKSHLTNRILVCWLIFDLVHNLNLILRANCITSAPYRALFLVFVCHSYGRVCRDGEEYIAGSSTFRHRSVVIPPDYIEQFRGGSFKSRVSTIVKHSQWHLNFCPTESYCIARVRYVYLTLHVGFILD